MTRGEQYAAWMKAEANYALGKFPSADNYAYLKNGVNRGDFCFGVSAVGYVHRAAMFEELAAEHPRARLQFVQIGERLDTDPLVRMPATGSVVSDRTRCFEVLQEMQDRMSGAQEADQAQRYAALFLGRTAFECEVASGHFVWAAERYGWPAPGLSSGNVEPWGSAAEA